MHVVLAIKRRADADQKKEEGQNASASAAAADGGEETNKGFVEFVLDMPPTQVVLRSLSAHDGHRWWRRQLRW